MQISESCLRRRLDRADVDDGHKVGVASDERKEPVQLRRKNRVLEMEYEILKRASAHFVREDVLPKGWIASPWLRSDEWRQDKPEQLAVNT